MKKILLFIFGLLFLISPNISFAKEINAYLFYGEGCPHCAKEEEFLDSIKGKYPELKINRFEVFLSRKNTKLMQSVASGLGKEVGGVPFMVIGEKSFVGYAEGITNVDIENAIKESINGDYKDMVAPIIEKDNIEKEKIKAEKKKILDTSEKKIKLPFLGEVNVYKISLPVLAMTMGLLDGFNPCAMWVLIFLISMLIGMKDRKKMWTIGTAFIVASAFVYFVFMSAWLNLVLFLGVILFVRLIIGALALFGGGYSLFRFFKQKENTCEVTNDSQKNKIVERLKKITKESNLFLAVGGVVVLAFMVNLIELVCSAGLPAVFTQVLAMNDLSTLSYYGYILLYILFFMLDDLVVFFIAMKTFKITGVTTKYTRYSNLIGGIIMIIIGILLVFKPQLLMFG